MKSDKKNLNMYKMFIFQYFFWQTNIDLSKTSNILDILNIMHKPIRTPLQFFAILQGYEINKKYKLKNIFSYIEKLRKILFPSKNTQHIKKKLLTCVIFSLQKLYIRLKKDSYIICMWICTSFIIFRKVFTFKCRKSYNEKWCWALAVFTPSAGSDISYKQFNA
jgi:hypothetical protein